MKRPKIGLKLFSENTVAIDSARRCYEDGLFDYLELMALPGTYQDKIKYWKQLNVPYVIHAPHGKYGFNLSQPERRKSNAAIFAETRKYADELDAEFIILHPGLAGQVDETARQIKRLKDERIAVENKPWISLLQTRCVGSSPEEIARIIKTTGAYFCFDIVHSVKAAFADGKGQLDYIRAFLAIKPKIVHLCDAKRFGCFDEHLNLGAGELDLPTIVRLSLKAVPDAYFTLEIPERSYQSLSSFKKDRVLAGKYLGVAKR